MSSGTPIAPRKHLPAWDVFTSLFGFGPIPFSYLARAPRLFEERRRVDPSQVPPTEHTPLELSLRIKTLMRADALVEREVRTKLHPQAEYVTTMASRRDALVDDIDRIKFQTCTDLLGKEAIDLETARKRSRELAAAIGEAELRGSVLHREYSSQRRALPWVFVGLDLVLLGYFFVNTLGVDWSFNVETLVATVIRLALAIVLTALFTFGIAYTMHFFGDRHRKFKNDDGGLTFPSRGPRLESRLAVGILAIPAVLVSARTLIDLYVRSGNLLLAIAVGVGIAVIMVLINWLIYQTRATDGSLLLDRLTHLTPQVVSADQRRESLLSLRDLLFRQIQTNVEKFQEYVIVLDQRVDDMLNRNKAVTTILYIRSVADAAVLAPTIPQLHAEREDLSLLSQRVADALSTALADIRSES